jgi:hypothetical protein
MTTLRQATRALFTGDVTFMALATGGVHDVDSLGRMELELADITSGSPIVLPSLFIRWTTEAPFSLRVLEARSIFFNLFFFDHSNYTVIEQLRHRAYQLLHQQRVTFDEPSGDYLYAFVWAGDVCQSSDESLQGARMERARYEGHLVKE